MFTVTLSTGRQFLADQGTTVLDAAAKNGVVLEHSCRTGRCGSCKALVLAGDSNPVRDEASLSSSEVASGWILTCAREALTDLSLDIEDLGELAGISAKILPCRVAALDMLAQDVLKVTLRLPPNATFAFLAGQFVEMIGAGGLKRSYSIANSGGTSGLIELHIRRVDEGKMSRYWFEQARLNDLLRLRGPLGTFVLREIEGIDVVFLATGTGIAPVKAMLETLPAMGVTPRSVSLFWGGRRPTDLYWDPIMAGTSLTYTPVLSRANADWQGARGHIQNVFLAQQPDLARTAVYACGSDAMIHETRSQLLTLGLPARRFHSDAFVSSGTA